MRRFTRPVRITPVQFTKALRNTHATPAKALNRAERNV